MEKDMPVRTEAGDRAAARAAQREEEAKKDLVRKTKELNHYLSMLTPEQIEILDSLTHTLDQKLCVARVAIGGNMSVADAYNQVIFFESIQNADDRMHDR